MVPIPESVYFPPLDKCLDGEKLLISWRTVFIAQSKARDDDRAHAELEAFLSEPYVLGLLARPYNPYSFTTSAQAKSTFETKTAAINVTPTTKREYSINEIKDDALWLCKEVQIDEVSALRFVVLEYQTRASEQLRCDFSDEERASLHEIGGNLSAELSTVVPRAKVSNGMRSDTTHNFDSKESRRLRTLRLYLLERRYLLKCSGAFLQAALDEQKKVNGASGKGKRPEADPTGIIWMHRVGLDLLATLDHAGRSTQECLLDSIRFLKAKFSSLENGSGWLKQEGGREDLESEWLSSNILEAVYIMEIVFRFVDSQGLIPSSEVVLEWFRFVSLFGFFDHFETPFSSTQAIIPSLQSLVSVISLALLDPQRALEDFFDAQDVSQSIEGGLRHTPYISDLQTMIDLHKFLIDAASVLSPLASPAVLAWSIIVKAMRDTSIARKEARELRQSVRAQEALEDDASFEEETSLGNRSGRPLSARRYSASSEGSAEIGIYDSFLETIKDTSPEEDPILFLGSRAVEGSNVFDVLTSLAVFFAPPTYLDALGTRIRLVILTLTRCSIEVLNYTPEVVTTTLAVLSGEHNFWDLLEYPAVVPSDDPLAIFLQDDYLVQRILNTAMSRYPYETLPFLKTIRAVAACRTLDDDGSPIAVRILESIPSFTFQLPQNFRCYETIQEEDNANTIQLTKDVLLFQPRNGMKIAQESTSAYGESLALTESPTQFRIPRGTPGRIVSDSDSGPKVATWFQEYSGLKYMGKLLETALTAGDYVDSTTGEPIDRECVAEIIGLLATLLLATTQIGELNDKNEESHGNAYHILEEASDGLDRNRDIVTVIFKIFEEELQRQSSSLSSDISLDVLVASIQFIFALVPILPGRVWPLLGRCELLDIDGRGGRLSAIIGRIEMVNCRFDFLISCTYLFYALVEDSVRHAVLRKVGSKTLVRQGSKGDLGTGVPEQILSKVLLLFTRVLVDVSESACSWRFAMEKQRLQLSELISTVLQSILHYTYSADDSSKPDAKLTKALMPASDYILDSFLVTTSAQARFRPILRVFLDGFANPDLTLQSGLETRWLGAVKSTVIFITTLIKARMLVNRPTPQLEHHLFKLSPLIARLYAVHESYGPHVVKLFEALILSASTREGEPPSLLGYLGPQTSKHFIHILLNLDKPLDEDKNVIAIWHLMSVVVSSRQQWFSISLLTGRPPRQALKDSSAENQVRPARTLSKIALDALSNIQSLPLPKALAMLEFISLAQNYWPWSMSDILLKKSNFINSISKFVDSLETVLATAIADRLVEVCYEIRMAACIAEILAMYLYHSRQVGNSAAKSELLPYIGFYVRLGAAAPFYNSSLHGNLKRNFESKFSGCTLQNFKRTKLVNREFGREYFYDLQLASKMLYSDQAWTGRKNDGLAEELARANVNLSLVDAQVALLHGWKLLGIELSDNISANADLQVQLAKVIKECLIANNKSQLPENIFTRLSQTRADFALILLQRLIESKCIGQEVLGLLSKIWETILNLESSFEDLIASSEANYYRALLKLLFLALRAHTGGEHTSAHSIDPLTQSSKPPSPQIHTTSGPSRVVLDVIRKVVAQGFQALVAAIHERPAESVADDLALVTAILQACLHFPGIEICYGQILEAMVACDTIRVATTLFSWSDKLALDGDPIYGELSILFLLELSSLPVIAEQLAVEGTLGHISNASITSYIRKANVSALAEGLGPQRCYSIWVRGILPLILNILDAVGAAVAAEVALFLNQFPKLLQQSVEAVEVPHTTLGRTMSPPRITYSMISEVHSLSLIIYVLTTFRTSLAGINEIPEVKWDNASALDSVEHWLTERAVLRQRILPLDLKEMEMAKQKPLSVIGGCENRLEEKVVEELLVVKDILTSEEA